MIIWRGLGILVGIAGFVGVLLASIITAHLTKDDAYYKAHIFPQLIGAVLAAALSYGMVMILNKGDKPKIVIDKESGEEIEIRRGDALFFIPIKYWPYLFAIIYTIVAFLPANE